jgi:hypothetical protein
MSGCLRVADVVRLRPDVLWKAHASSEPEQEPVYAILREEAQPMFETMGTGRKVWITDATAAILGLPHMSTADLNLDGRRSAVEFRAAIKYMKAYTTQARYILQEKEFGAAASSDPVEIATRDEVMAETKDAAGRAARTLATHPLFADLGTTLYAALTEAEMYFPDLHIGNVGWRVHDDIEGDVRPLTAVIIDPGIAETPYRPTVPERVLQNRRRR